MTENDAYSADCVWVGVAVQVMGCTNNTACNFDAAANTDDGSCYFVGDPCDDQDPSTEGDVITASCECAGVQVGVQEWQQQLSYYPNPASDWVRVELRDGKLIDRIEAIDMQGRVVMSQAVLATVANVDVKSMPAGRYTLIVKTAEGSYPLPLTVLR
jgi:hypothetical protein